MTRKRINCEAKLIQTKTLFADIWLKKSLKTLSSATAPIVLRS